MSRERVAEALLAWNTLIWGATFVVVKSALTGISPLYFLALRFTLATAALLALFRGAGKGARDWKSVGAGIMIGSLLFGGFVTQTLGLRLTSAPKSAFLTGLCSVLVPVLAGVVYRIRPQGSDVAGLLVATVGLGLMTLHGSLGSISQGDLLTLLCAFGFAAHIVALGHYSGQVSFELLSVTQIATSAGWSWALLWWLEKPHVEWRPSVVCAILVTGLLATALAFTIQAWAQRYTTSARTALIYMLEPVMAWLTSYFLTGEGLSGRAAAGAGLILGGVVLVEVKPLGTRPHPS
ncbi:MAG: DMT family transporter [Bryobacteraceae bacterium]